MINLDQINKCLINLPERRDRLERSEKELKKFFTNTDRHLIDGVKDLPVFKGIASAHLKCINWAKANDLGEVLIIEDDVKFQSLKSRSYADECFNNLPGDWDILLGSVYLSRGLTKYNEHWSLTREFCGLTFYVANQKAYDAILNFDKSMHIDRAMYSKLGLNCYVANQFFAIQYSGKSDNTGKIEDYDHLLNRFEVLK